MRNLIPHLITVMTYTLVGGGIIPSPIKISGTIIHYDQTVYAEITRITIRDVG